MAEAREQSLKRSPLFDSQRELGAEFAEQHGWLLAESYSDPSSEHLAVRANAGLIDLCSHGVIKIGGSEAIQFLNGLVTNNVKTLAQGKGMRAAFLTGHGKVRALCRVLSLGSGEYLVINDPQTHDQVFKYVSPFSQAGDFRVEDASEQYRLLSVQGPRSELILKESCFEPVHALQAHDWFEALIAGHRALVVKATHTGEPGFDVFAPAEALKDIWDFLLLKGSFHSIVPFGLSALDSLRIEAGIPVYGVDVNETNMMLEIGLADAVSFDKGCYTGQEPVAMATYRGHVSKRLSGLRVAGEIVPEPGQIVRKDGKEIGFVTSALRSLSVGAVIALAYLKYGFFDPGAEVEVQTESQALQASVVELPFYRASQD